MLEFEWAMRGRGCISLALLLFTFLVKEKRKGRNDEQVCGVSEWRDKDPYSTWFPFYVVGARLLRGEEDWAGQGEE